MAKAIASVDEMLAMPALVERGWTEAMVKRFLGAPDATKPNPVFRSAAPMRLWRSCRVAEVEATHEWAAAVEVAKRRRAAGRKVADAKRTETCAMVEALPLSVKRLDRDTLVKRACQSYNAHQAELAAYRNWVYEWEPASESSSASFLDRICVNYLRHEATPYEEGLGELYGRVGRVEADRLWRGRVYRVISECYPELAAECRAQIVRREEEGRIGYLRRF